jgi:hypothetical protein
LHRDGSSLAGFGQIRCAGSGEPVPWSAPPKRLGSLAFIAPVQPAPSQAKMDKRVTGSLVLNVHCFSASGDRLGRGSDPNEGGREER